VDSAVFCNVFLLYQQLIIHDLVKYYTVWRCFYTVLPVFSTWLFLAAAPFSFSFSFKNKKKEKESGEKRKRTDTQV